MKYTKKGFPQLPLWDPVEDKTQEGIARTLPLQPDDGGRQARTYHAIDVTTDVWHAGAGLLLSILVEIWEEREVGRLRPFVEGEPIGTIQLRRPFAPILETPAERYERKQEELRALRAKNDRAMAHILERA